ncbi:MAG: cytochrome-c peroxidase, partial [Methyloligellaceae bacterium]
MNTSVIELLAFGLFVVIAGVFMLISLVRELAPMDRRRWLLAIGLGAGVITFGLKIAMIVTLSTFPEFTIELLPKQVYVRKLSDDVAYQHTALDNETVKKNYIWEALPATAPYPIDNPTTPEKVALGKKLFFDNTLSADESLSCASCHELSSIKGGADGLSQAIGIYGQQGKRNVPTVLNAAFQRVLFWDGRVSSLEEQAKGPLTNPVEMGMPSLNSVEERVKSNAGYQQEFANAFPGSPVISIDNIVKAIAAYERTLITPMSPYDRFIGGDSSALTKIQLEGMALFESTGCVNCHSGPNFSGASVYGENAAYRAFPAFLNSDYSQRYQFTEDVGVVNGNSKSLRGVWRIPFLRNVARTAPYFH